MADAFDPRELDDEAYLGWVFERAWQGSAAGEQLRTDDLLAGRPHLRGEVEEALRRAAAVRARQAGAVPRIAGYEILGELGRGAFATVHLARQDSLARPVALKVLRYAALLPDRERRRFIEEARSLARITHPGVVTVHDVVEHEDVCAFAMERIEGATLARIIQHLSELGGRADLADVRTFLDAPEGALDDRNLTVFLCRVGVSVARALGAVHRAGLLHRDVKPSNVLIRRDGEALLSDFGLARGTAGGSLTRTGEFVGTPLYAAPEQLREEHGYVDARTDVYSLGVTLYHALARRRPYEGSSLVTILRQIESGRVPPLRRLNRELPRDLETVVAKAMDPDPDHRYATADALTDDLERLLSLRPIAARRAGPLSRLAKRIRRNRSPVLAAIATGVAAAVLALTWSVWSGRRAAIPERVDALLAEARLALLDEAWGEVVFTEVHELHRPVREQALSRERAERALELYWRALELDPRHAQARIESEVLHLARTLSTGGEPGGLAVLEETCPLTVAWARRHGDELLPGGAARDRSYAQLDESGLASASDTDRWALGFLGFLCSEREVALTAWSSFDLSADPNHFVLAALGELHLAMGEPALGYARLLLAVEGFPEAGFLAADLADAALRSGDVAAARQFVDRARGLGRHDSFGTLDRVEADVRAALGEDEVAEARYVELLERYDTPTLFLSYARFLEQRGRGREAVELYRLLGECYGGVTAYRELLVDAARSWWDSLSTADKVGVVAHELGWTGSDQSLLVMLRDRIAEDGGGEDVPMARERRIGGPPALEELFTTARLLDMDARDWSGRPEGVRRFVAALAVACDRRRAESSHGGRSALDRILAHLSRPARRGARDAPTYSLGAQGARVLLGSSGEPGSLLGAAVVGLPDVDGDGCADLAAGAPGAAGGAGTVLVLSGSDGRRLQAHRGGRDGERLGACLAGAGDVDADGVPDLIASLRAVDPEEFGVGDVVVYSTRDGSRLHRFRDRGGKEASVAGCAGDVDGDGRVDLIVGTSPRGAAEVYSGRDGALLLSLEGDPNARFGAVVAGAGDLDGDGLADLAIGAPFTRGRGAHRGEVLAYSGADGAPIHRLAGDFAGDRFGGALAAGRDLDGDGSPDLAVGSVGDDNRGSCSGSIRVVSGADGSTLAVHSGDARNDGLGRCVALVDDLDGDGLPDVLVGAPRAGAPGAEGVDPPFFRAYSGVSGSVLFTVRATAPRTGLGRSVAALLDMDGDGRPELLAGAPRHAVSEEEVGAVFVLSLPRGGPPAPRSHQLRR